MTNQKSSGKAGLLPDVFVPATWRGTASRRGAALVGVSFDLGGGGVVRLALPAESARMLMESLRDYLEGPKDGGEAFDMSPYCGDDYDRVGCSVSIDVTATRYSVVVRAPNGAVIESWGEHEPGVLARRLAAWCRGREPDGQLSESKS